ncbi:hypothetical protein GCM10020255_093350 [Rhodococcus baikonurensis]
MTGIVNPVHKAWPGLIEAYRDRLAIGDNWKTVTLREGGTPLLPAATSPRSPVATSTSRSRASTPLVPSRTAA